MKMLEMIKTKTDKIIGRKYCGYANKKPMLKIVNVSIATSNNKRVSKTLSGLMSLSLLNICYAFML
jgi:hypothetical protein